MKKLVLALLVLTSCNINAIICAADARTLQAAESAAHPKMLNHKVLAFISPCCKHEQ